MICGTVQRLTRRSAAASSLWGRCCYSSLPLSPSTSESDQTGGSLLTDLQSEAGSNLSDASSISLESTESIAAPMAHALDTIHQLSGLPWWMTLMAGGAAVRIGLFPLTMKAGNATEYVMECFGRASKMVAAERKEDAGETTRESMNEVVLRVKDMLAQRPDNIPRPLWIIASPVINISVLIYGLYSVRYMSRMEWPGFESGGPSWALDLTLPAVDWMTLTTPLGMQGIVMPGLLIAGLHASIRKIRPPSQNSSDTAPKAKENEQVRRWALNFLATCMEVMTIPVLLGALTSSQAPLYYWTTGVGTSLALQAAWKSHDNKKTPVIKHGDLSSSARELLEKAATLVADGSPGKAMPLLEQALTINPRHPSTLMALAQTSASQQQWKKSEEYHRMLLEVATESGIKQKALFGMGMCLARTSQHDKALDILEKAVEAFDASQEPSMKPLAVRSLLSMAAIAKAQGDASKSAILLGRAVDLDPSVEKIYSHTQGQKVV